MIKKQYFFLVLMLSVAISINGMQPEMSNEEFQALEQELFGLAEEPLGPEEDTQEQEEREAQLEGLIAEAPDILSGVKTDTLMEEKRIEQIRESLSCFKKFIIMFDDRISHKIEDVALEFNPELVQKLKKLTEFLDDASSRAASLTDAQVKEIGQKIVDGVDHIVFMLEQAGRLRGFNWVEAQKTKHAKELAQKDAEIEALKRQLAEVISPSTKQEETSSVTLQRDWIKQLVGLAEYLHRESTLTKREFSRQNQKALERVVQELTRISKQVTLTERDLQDARQQIEQAKTIYLSVRSGRIVTIPDLPKKVTF